MPVTLPYNATPDVVEALRRPRRMRLGRAPAIVRKGVAPIMRLHGASTGRALVQVREGEWSIQCPFCPGPEALSGGLPAPALDIYRRPIDIHVCPLCRNSADGGRVTETLWPEPRYRRAIEETLIVRPRLNRFWTPGPPLYETHMTLVAENIEHKYAPSKNLPLVA